jgi:hypothetical protein
VPTAISRAHNPQFTRSIEMPTKKPRRPSQKERMKKVSLEQGADGDVARKISAVVSPASVVNAVASGAVGADAVASGSGLEDAVDGVTVGGICTDAVPFGTGGYRNAVVAVPAASAAVVQQASQGNSYQNMTSSVQTVESRSSSSSIRSSRSESSSVVSQRTSTIEHVSASAEGSDKDSAWSRSSSSMSSLETAFQQNTEEQSSQDVDQRTFEARRSSSTATSLVKKTFSASSIVTKKTTRRSIQEGGTMSQVKEILESGKFGEFSLPEVIHEAVIQQPSSPLDKIMSEIHLKKMDQRGQSAAVKAVDEKGSVRKAGQPVDTFDQHENRSLTEVENSVSPKIEVSTPNGSQEVKYDPHEFKDTTKVSLEEQEATIKGESKVKKDLDQETKNDSEDSIDELLEESTKRTQENMEGWKETMRLAWIDQEASKPDEKHGSDSVRSQSCEDPIKEVPTEVKSDIGIKESQLEDKVSIGSEEIISDDQYSRFLEDIKKEIGCSSEDEEEVEDIAFTIRGRGGLKGQEPIPAGNGGYHNRKEFSIFVISSIVYVLLKRFYVL